MKQKERIAMQRAMAHEAFGKMRAVAELFGAEEDASDFRSMDDLDAWQKKIDALEAWVWGESPIA